MSYLEKRKSRGPKWISLGRAFRHVLVAVDPPDVYHELLSALLDGELPARFCATSPEFGKADTYHLPKRIQAVPVSFWQHCMIFPIGEGYVVSTAIRVGEEQNELPERRNVLVDYDRVLEIWPAQNATAPDAKIASVNVSQLSRASHAEIERQLELIYQKSSVPPNVERAYHVVLEELKKYRKTAPRSMVRKILNTSGFVTLRRRRGRPAREKTRQ